MSSMCGICLSVGCVQCMFACYSPQVAVPSAYVSLDPHFFFLDGFRFCGSAQNGNI